ncbi:MAG: tryptophan synthase subunit alpha [Candidatus Altiarchaeota archaeon]|nr:tryptophan synthase subunit alpha [Candidatus Altiarchaeota archaeon]
MNELEKTLREGGKLIAFIVGGDPSPDKSYKIASGVIEAGADVLEVGLPFSDPLADGPTIQKASERALKAGMNTDKYFKLIKRVRDTYETPLVCLTYYNIILQYGLEKFAQKAAYSGLDGIIVPDLPYEESEAFRKTLKKQSVDFIFLVAETTPPSRMKKIASAASGFIYVVSLLGTTGARKNVAANVKKTIARIRDETDLPLAVGFGISSPENVSEVMSFGADAAIVGSAIVKLAHEKGTVGLHDYVASLKKAAAGSRAIAKHLRV